MPALFLHNSSTPSRSTIYNAMLCIWRCVERFLPHRMPNYRLGTLYLEHESGGSELVPYDRAVSAEDVQGQSLTILCASVDQYVLYPSTSLSRCLNASISRVSTSQPSLSAVRKIYQLLGALGTERRCFREFCYSDTCACLEDVCQYSLGQTFFGPANFYVYWTRPP